MTGGDKGRGRQGERGRGGERCGLLSAKGGLMMGTKKGGSSLQPAEREPISLYQKKMECKGKF